MGNTRVAKLSTPWLPLRVGIQRAIIHIQRHRMKNLGIIHLNDMLNISWMSALMSEHFILQSVIDSFLSIFLILSPLFNGELVFHPISYLKCYKSSINRYHIWNIIYISYEFRYFYIWIMCLITRNANQIQEEWALTQILIWHKPIHPKYTVIICIELMWRNRFMKKLERKSNHWYIWSRNCVLYYRITNCQWVDYRLNSDK